VYSCVHTSGLYNIPEVSHDLYQDVSPWHPARIINVIRFKRKGVWAFERTPHRPPRSIRLDKGGEEGEEKVKERHGGGRWIEQLKIQEQFKPSAPTPPTQLLLRLENTCSG